MESPSPRGLGGAKPFALKVRPRNDYVKSRLMAAFVLQGRDMSLWERAPGKDGGGLLDIFCFQGVDDVLPFDAAAGIEHGGKDYGENRCHCHQVAAPGHGEGKAQRIAHNLVEKQGDGEANGQAKAEGLDAVKNALKLIILPKLWGVMPTDLSMANSLRRRAMLVVMVLRMLAMQIELIKTMNPVVKTVTKVLTLRVILAVLGALSTLICSTPISR